MSAIWQRGKTQQQKTTRQNRARMRFLTRSGTIWQPPGTTHRHIPIDGPRHTRASRSCSSCRGPRTLPFQGVPAFPVHPLSAVRDK
ncbi:hypothetical protein KZ770_26995 [Escherichia coli]|nr:hypothetical protein [Escherichia coli]